MIAAERLAQRCEGAYRAEIGLHKIVRLDVEASARVPNDEPVDEIYALDCSCRSPDPLDIGF